MAAGPDTPSDMHAGPDTERAGDRRNRAVISLVVLVALVVLFVWWLWSNTAIVPDVTGLSEPDARAAIEAAGFKVGEVRVDKTALEAPGRIDDQGVAPGVRALKGDTIDLFVADAGDGIDEPDVSGVVTGTASGFAIEEETGDSVRDRGDDEFNTSLGTRRYPGAPQVLNQTEASARTELQDAGYRVRIVRAPNAGGIAKGRVFYQKPEPGGTVTGGVVEIWISTGFPPEGHRKRPNVPWEKS